MAKKLSHKQLHTYIGTASLLATIISLGIGVSAQNLQVRTSSKAYLPPSIRVGQTTPQIPKTEPTATAPTRGTTNPRLQVSLAPVITATAPQDPTVMAITNNNLPNAIVGSNYLGTVIVYTPNDTTINLGAINLPSELKTNPCTKVASNDPRGGFRHLCRLSGTVTARPMTYSVSITATDTQGFRVTKGFKLVVSTTPQTNY